MRAHTLHQTLHRSTLSVLVAIIVLLFLATVSVTPVHADASPAMWFADHNTFKRVDPETNVVVPSFTITSEPTALAVNLQDGALWVLLNKHLLKLDATGQTLKDVDLKKVAGWSGDPLYLALDPYDGSLWVASYAVFLHFDSSGNKLAQGSASDSIRALSIDIDESVWVLTEKALLHFTSQALLKEQVNLKPLLRAPRLLSVDSLGSTLWIANAKKLLRFDLLHITTAPAIVSLPNPYNTMAEDDDSISNDDMVDDGPQRILALTSHPILGTLWVALKDGLLLFDRSGMFIKRLDLSGYAIDKVKAMVYEPTGLGLWLASRKSLLRFTINAEFVTLIRADKEISTVCAEPFQLLPSISIRVPNDGTLSNNPYLPFQVGVGAVCSGIPCTLSNTYFQSFTLDASLNNQAIGSLFHLSGDEMQYVPAVRLPEGGNVFSVRATDFLGHATAQASTRFTIDTIPPKFLSLTPADGTNVATAGVMIQGTLDDSTANVMLLDRIGNVISLASGRTFSFAVTLNSGANTFTLTARDAAGNAASTSLTLNYNPIRVAVTSIASDTTINADQLSLNGTIDGLDNIGITVNGVVATVANGKFYVNNLLLQPGPNTVTVIATTPDGQTVTKTLTVTSSGPSLFRVTVSPQSGVAPMKTSFTVTNQTTLDIQRIAVDFDGDGTVDFITTDRTEPIAFTYVVPGVYQPTIFVTDSQGTTSSQTLSVVALDAVQMDTFFKSIWSGMNSALGAGNLQGANKYLSLSAQRKYQPVFQALLPHLNEIIASYSSPRRVTISQDIGEYAINRTYQGQNRLYLIYFLKGADGVWRMDAM